MIKLSQRGFTHLVVLLILLVGVVTGIYLVQHTQIFRPKAAYLDPESDPILRPRIIAIRDTFRIDSQVPTDQIDQLIKDDLLRSGLQVNGEPIREEAEVSVLGDSIDGKSDLELSKLGVFPPIYISPEVQNKAIAFAKDGAELTADFIIPYSQGKRA